MGGRISAPQGPQGNVASRTAFSTLPGVRKCSESRSRSIEIEGPRAGQSRHAGCRSATSNAEPSVASVASVAMENVIGMVSAKWAEWDAYVEPLVFTYIEKVSFFRSRWWWQRCKRFLVCLYCQRKAAARSQRPAPQLQALTHHFSHPRASMLENRFSGRTFGKNLRSTFGSNRTSSSPPRSR